MRRAIVIDGVAYLALFAVQAVPWFARMAVRLPGDVATRDAWLIFWVLDWVAHALWTAPGAIFDPPVNYPAPSQLAGSEHFFAWQLVYAPLRAATGSSIIAANLTAFVSYPLAALAMQRCLVGMGLARQPAFVAGFLYAAAWGVPAHLHVLQYSHLCLPLVVAALHGLRRRPDVRHALALFGALELAVFSSYHMAVYVGLAATVWGAAELVRPGTLRWRYAVLAIGTAAMACVGLIAVSTRYLDRPEAGEDRQLMQSFAGTGHLIGERIGFQQDIASPAELVVHVAGCVISGGNVHLCMRGFREGSFDWAASAPTLIIASLALGGIGVALRSRRRRLDVAAAIAVAAMGALVVEPFAVRVGSLDIPMLASWLASTPARFIRVPMRALVMTIFGTGVLMAVGLDAVWCRLGRRALPLAIVAALACVVHLPPDSVAETEDNLGFDFLTRWSRFAPGGYVGTTSVDRDASLYRAIAAYVDSAGPGPLLEWPTALEASAPVVGQTIHRQPSIRFYTGYTPLHLLLVEPLVQRLPDPDALDDLIDMTTLRWILVRPPDEWWQPGRYARDLGRLLQSPRVLGTQAFGNFVLVELDHESHHPAWFRGIASGVRPDLSVLGTPIAPLPSGAAEVRIAGATTVTVNRELLLLVEILNRGTTGWPAALPRRLERPLGVFLVVRWRAADGQIDRASRRALPRDVPAGESLRESLVVAAPSTPGAYHLEVGVEQVKGTDLASPHNPASLPVIVNPAGPPRSSGSGQAG